MASDPHRRRPHLPAFVAHAAVFVGLAVLTRGRMLGPTLTMLWCAALVVHGLVAALPRGWARRDDDATASEPGGVAAGRPLRASRGFWGEASQLIDALEQQRRDGRLHPRLDVAALREAALDLHHRAESLASLGGEADLLQLQLQQEEAAARVADATDETSAEAFENEVLAIAHRRASLDAALRTRARLLARQRTLLHQLQSLRAAGAHAQASAVEGADDELNAQAEQLLDELRANREVEEELARGRRTAARSRRQGEPT